MNDFIAEIQGLITEYDSTYNVSNMSITLAIEIFADLRNYPNSYTDEMKLSDMHKNISKISMASIEIDAKVGIENQTTHSESGINRTYASNLIAYTTVVPFVNIL